MEKKIKLKACLGNQVRRRQLIKKKTFKGKQTHHQLLLFV